VETLALSSQANGLILRTITTQRRIVQQRNNVVKHTALLWNNIAIIYSVVREQLLSSARKRRSIRWWRGPDRKAIVA